MTKHWNVDAARAQYAIPHWGEGYFDVDGRGRLSVRPHGAGGFEAVDLRNLRVVERREHVRFARKPCHPVGIAFKDLRENLQRDVAIQGRVTGTVYLAHAACADRGNDLVHADASAGRQRQMMCRNYS